MITFANQLSHRVIDWIRVRGFQDLVFLEPVKVSAFVPAFPLDSSPSVEGSTVNMKGLNQ